MKLSSKCRTKKLGMIFTILGKFCSFLTWEGAYIWPQIRPRKIPVIFAWWCNRWTSEQIFHPIFTFMINSYLYPGKISKILIWCTRKKHHFLCCNILEFKLSFMMPKVYAKLCVPLPWKPWNPEGPAPGLGDPIPGPPAIPKVSYCCLLVWSLRTYKRVRDASRPLRACNWWFIFLLLNQNICCGYSKESSL